MPLAGRIVEDHEGAPPPLGLDPVLEQGVGAGDLPGLGQRDAQLQRQVPLGGVVVGEQRHRPVQQPHRRCDVAPGQRAPPRGPEPGGRPRRQLAPVVAEGAELVQVGRRPLQVVPEDLLELACALPRRALQPVGEALVVVRAGLLQDPLVGDVPDHDVLEAEGGLAGEAAGVSMDELLALQRDQALVQLRPVVAAAQTSLPNSGPSS